VSEWIPFYFDDGEAEHFLATEEAWERFIAEGGGRQVVPVVLSALCDYPTERGVEPPHFGYDMSAYHHSPSLKDWARSRGVGL
jgi:hypothetical protein